MFGEIHHLGRRIAVLSAALSAACMLTACGQEHLAGDGETDRPAAGTESGKEPADTEPADGEYEAPGTEGDSVLSEGAAADMPEAAQEEADGLRERFGENCIPEQTFEVELSEYPGKVWFVPFAPVGNDQDFTARIIQDGEILTEIEGYVPEELLGKSFESLDAVSFFDMNYDGSTDIVMLCTYGGRSFAAVYYGEDSEDEYRPYFWAQDTLSKALSEQVNPLTFSEIRDYLGGRKNGEFADYREAYQAVVRLQSLESADSEETYDLIYVDEDDVPELTIGVDSYWVSLYTYRDGTVYTLMDNWGYGAGGNVGYEYAPRKNNLRNYSNDYAGAISYLTYMTIGEKHTLDTMAEIRTVLFDDVNENGVPDEEEMGSLGNYEVSYLNGEEIAAEEWEEKCAVYDAGEYVFLEGRLSREEMLGELGA